MLFPIVVFAYVYTLPESPRWLLLKAREGKPQFYSKAFDALCSLRHSKLQAARDLFLIDYLVEKEQRIWEQRNRLQELFTIGRNRRALIASVINLFNQQFCGVNVHAYVRLPNKPFSVTYENSS